MNLQTLPMKIDLILVIVLIVSLIIYIRKVIMYKNDERGQTILGKASTWVSISVGLVFIMTFIAQYFFEVLEDYATWFNTFMALFITSTYLTQVLGIFYYERKI